jgi:hypothetical integral membrane protein (TIGR02206 family)
MAQEFAPFSGTHYAAMATGAAAIAVLAAMGRRGGRTRAVATGLLAFWCVAAWSLKQLAWNIGGDPAPFHEAFPFHLCGIVAFVAGFALLTRHHTLCALTYYWGLAASIQGILTPALDYGFPHPVFFVFFANHIAIVGAAVYLPAALGWRPQPLLPTLGRVMLWSEVYFFTMLPLNFLLGTNYGFLREKPPNPSLLDYFGPWPWYLLGLQIALVVALFLLSLPFLRPKSGT